MAASLPVMLTLAAGEDADVMTGPCVMTDVIVSELTGSAGAGVVVSGAEDERTYMILSAVAGQTVVWHGKLVMSGGINVASQMGDVAVTVGYY